MQSIKFLNASDGTANASLMTVQTLRSPGATTILVNTVTGVHATGFHASMGAPHTFTDPVTGETITIISDATAVDFAGHINAGQIIIDAIAPGYVDTRGSAVGDIVIIRPTTDWSNNVANVLAAGALADNGTLATTALDAFFKPSEQIFDFVVPSSGNWAGLGYGTTLTASMAALTFYVNGLRNTIAALPTRTFTANKDTYVDALFSSTGTGTLVYTEVANNAASPALAANSVRLAIVVSGATITAATAINQGEYDRLLPIAASRPYAFTDSLGNIIRPTDPSRRLLGYSQLASFSTTSGAQAAVTGLVAPVIIPNGRRIKASLISPYMFNANAGNETIAVLWASSVGGTAITGGRNTSGSANEGAPLNAEAPVSGLTGFQTFLAGLNVFAAGTAWLATSGGGEVIGVRLLIELE